MSQIITKFITDNAVTGAKIRLANAEMFRGRNAAGTADINILMVNASNVPEFQTLPTVNAGIGIPSSAKQLATVEYITNYVQGKQQAKDAVQVIAVVQTALTGTAPLIIDGISLTQSTTNEPTRVGLTGQTTGSQNGIYDYTVATGTYTLTRSADFDQINDPNGLEVTTGAYFMVVQGTTYAGYECVLTTTGAIVIGTTSLTFAKYPSTLSLTAGDMLTKTGNVFSVNLQTLSGLKSTNPGVAGGQLFVYTDNSAAVKDQTTRIDPSSGSIMAPKHQKTSFTLAAGDITNQYVDLAVVAANNSIMFNVIGGPIQIEGTDYSVNYTGGSGGNTRITFLGGIATGGVSALVVGDVLNITHRSY